MAARGKDVAVTGVCDADMRYLHETMDWDRAPWHDGWRLNGKRQKWVTDLAYKLKAWNAQGRIAAMLTRRSVARCVAVVIAVASAGSIPKAASAADIVGTYKLASAKNFGDSPTGTAMFDAKGRFAIILMRGDLPKYASNKRIEGTADEYKATASGSLAYFGTYTVSGTEIILNIEKSTFANQDGTQAKRIDVVISGDELKYTNPAPTAGGAPDMLVWKRSN